MTGRLIQSYKKPKLALQRVLAEILPKLKIKYFERSAIAAGFGSHYRAFPGVKDKFGELERIEFRSQLAALLGILQTDLNKVYLSLHHVRRNFA